MSMGAARIQVADGGRDVAEIFHEQGVEGPAAAVDDHVHRVQVLEGRLVDALAHQGVYKPPFEHGDAVDMIVNGRCGVFNPQLMEYFRDCAPAVRELYARRAD